LGDESKQVDQTTLNRLSEDDVRREVEEIFRHYYEDVLPVLVIATAESDGKRPDGLCNEIYSCFHHMARALCENKADVQDELKSAKKSHLKRAILDSYKIAINAHLNELRDAKDLLDYMVLVKDFSHYFPRGVELVAEIKALGKQIKGKYEKAKIEEAKGHSNAAIENFDQALEMCDELRDKLDVFTSDRTYIYACEREAERKKDRARERRNSIWVPIACSVVTAVLSIAGTFYVTKRNGGGQVAPAPPPCSQDAQRAPIRELSAPATKP
jgi:hypothetical protein